MELLKRIFDGQIKSIDEKERTLTAYVSTNSRDRMDEVLMPEGVDLSKFKKNPIVLWAHDYTQPPIGKALWIKRDGSGIISKMQFANTEFAQEIFNLYKDGFMKAFSVGFIPKEAKDGDGEKSPRRTYTKWEMLEYSAVPVPANPEALALAISKGMMDEHLKTYFEIPIEEKAKEGEGMIAEDKPAEKIDKPAEEKKTEKANPELLEELKTLKDENIKLRSVVQDLRYKLLDKDAKKERTLSGMTDSEILKKMEEIAVGVIRKITGKVA
jgi:HK97 family phage prohead protease